MTMASTRIPNSTSANLGTFPSEVTSWAALRTSARWEKKIALALKRVGVPVFLPMLTRRVIYPGKTQQSETPLFSGYIFCDEQAFLGNPAVLAANRKQIAQILKPGDSQLLRDELVRVAELVEHHELIQERLYGSPGDTVRIIAGPLSGSQGTVVALKPRKRLIVLEVSFLGARLEVEVEEHQVEKDRS